MLEAETDQRLSNCKSDKRRKNTSNHRNGRSKKTVKSDFIEIDLETPWNRGVRIRVYHHREAPEEHNCNLIPVPGPIRQGGQHPRCPELFK